MTQVDGTAFNDPGLQSLVQVVIVGAGVYFILLRVARARAFRILIGLTLLIAIYVLAWAAQLQIIQWVLQTVFGFGAIAALIIFQPELRSGLARLARDRLVHEMDDLEQNELVEEIVDAIERLSRASLGAIVVIERGSSLDEYADTGTRLEAQVNADLLVSIFSPYGPLHDGAVLIGGDTIFAAGVILPLTQFPVADRMLGTRHRAAIGISEETDSLAIVVSEETTQVSVAEGGRLQKGIDMAQLRRTLGAVIAERDA